MKPAENYIDINKQSWNNRTEAHIQSDFYDLKGFLAGQSSLNSIELERLGDLSGKRVLHLQCHFGMDTLSLARLGAQVTGVDFSDKAIDQANKLAAETQLDARFICCNIYDLPQQLNEQFDLVFTSYGTIGWLPDLDRWAQIVRQFLKPDGQFLFVEFHPVVWMFDDQFKSIAYSYFNTETIVETETGTYADRDADIQQDTVSWNHPISEVVNALLRNQLEITALDEFDYSPYNCFNNTTEAEPGKFRIAHLDQKLPMVYALKASIKK
ncbi:class I SAM-dependent methyltransferase [Sunxiuqinia elliptica]|uniref:Methyltransferase family protein n=1 Tax=Sunxiuqinia elliptica TaxID=655355 RepID=A0A4R6H670_9BACT|nr:class I SAM-dependent methyltransferase [Sunxiuqinia elliptica]TDO03702.1 methyltransferase family protein [Sunxiuqinia elliptica]TDO61983.1 methyltransferase family protein [Sunxiuqinia elliptica]